MIPAKKENNGCLQIFLLGTLSVFSFITILIIFPFSSNVTIIIAIVVSVLALKLAIKNTTLKSLIKSGIGVYIVFYGLQIVFNSFINILPKPAEDISFNKKEEVKKTIIIAKNDTIKLYTSNRNWTDNYGNHFAGDLSVREKDYTRLKNYIGSYTASTNINFWGHLYDYIERKDTPSLDLILKSFAEIGQENELNQMEFAEMVISCIQDIPYSFVLQEECPTTNFDLTTKAILEKCPECCIGHIKYGIQNPVSFMKNLKGDCDTRTVLIFSILKYFNYDVAIVNSQHYRHSIIGINLPASGAYKNYNGKKYMLWETTAKYFKIGKLPTMFNNVKYWNIVLTSK